MEPMRGPMMYPTPRSSGEASTATDPPLSGAPKIFSGVSFQRRSAAYAVL